jgi:hypothetical protein
MSVVRLRLFVLAVTLSLTIGEFIEVQQLAPADLRTRFGLLPSCDPSVTAVTTDPAANLVTVAIDCLVNPATTSPPAGASGERHGPSRGLLRAGGGGMETILVVDDDAQVLAIVGKMRGRRSFATAGQ